MLFLSEHVASNISDCNMTLRCGHKFLNSCTSCNIDEISKYMANQESVYAAISTFCSKQEEDIALYCTNSLNPQSSNEHMFWIAYHVFVKQKCKEILAFSSPEGS